MADGTEIEPLGTFLFWAVHFLIVIFMIIVIMQSIQIIYQWIYSPTTRRNKRHQMWVSAWVAGPGLDEDVGQSGSSVEKNKFHLTSCAFFPLWSFQVRQRCSQSSASPAPWIRCIVFSATDQHTKRSLSPNPSRNLFSALRPGLLPPSFSLSLLRTR